MTAIDLIGKYVRTIDAEAEYYSISRFTVTLGKGLMLARRLNPRNGNESSSSHVVSLKALAAADDDIFDSFEAARQDSRRLDEDQEPVARLVPKT